GWVSVFTSSMVVFHPSPFAKCAITRLPTCGAGPPLPGVALGLEITSVTTIATVGFAAATDAILTVPAYVPARRPAGLIHVLKSVLPGDVGVDPLVWFAYSHPESLLAATENGRAADV